MKDKNAPILQLLDRDVVTEIVDSAGTSFKKPWYGQLMTGPQLIAYFIQMNIWIFVAFAFCNIFIKKSDYN